MTKNGFQGLMKGVGQTGNGLAVAGGDQPAYQMNQQPVSGDPAQPGGGLGGIIRRKFFGGPAQLPQPGMGGPGVGTGPGSMVQRPNGMMNL